MDGAFTALTDACALMVMTSCSMVRMNPSLGLATPARCEEEEEKPPDVCWGAAGGAGAPGAEAPSPEAALGASSKLKAPPLLEAEKGTGEET